MYDLQLYQTVTGLAVSMKCRWWVVLDGIQGDAFS